MPLSSDRHIIDDQFSKKLRLQKAHPSGKVWNRLSGQLHLQEKRNNNGKRLLLVILLLLLGSGGVWVTSNLQPGKKITSKVLPSYSRNSIPEEINDASASAVTTNQSLNTVSSSVVTTVNGESMADERNINAAIEQEVDFYDAVMATKNVSENMIVITASSVPFSWTNGNSFMQPLDGVSQLSTEERQTHVKMKHTKDKTYPVASRNPDFYIANAAGWYLGFGETFNTTLIVDRRAFSDENLKFSPTFGTALMVHCGYNFNNKWGMEGAWVIHSQEGQRYKYLPDNNRTTSLEYNQKHVSFNYMQFPILMRHKVQGWSGVTETPMFVNYSLGVQYGRLITYSIDESKEKVSEQNLFRKNEYAVVAAVDYDFLTKKAAFFTLGIRTSLGSDLFVKDAPEYLEFEDPRNFLIGIHGALSFSLNKIQKAPPTFQ
ncbi:MAG: hypothetical protein ABIO46_13800 [Chitinophagales bacterium]